MTAGAATLAVLGEVDGAEHGGDLGLLLGEVGGAQAGVHLVEVVWLVARDRDRDRLGAAQGGAPAGAAGHGFLGWVAGDGGVRLGLAEGAGEAVVVPADQDSPGRQSV